jgi:hypothetical protein
MFPHKTGFPRFRIEDEAEYTILLEGGRKNRSCLDLLRLNASRLALFVVSLETPRDSAVYFQEVKSRTRPHRIYTPGPLTELHLTGILSHVRCYSIVVVLSRN